MYHIHRYFINLLLIVSIISSAQLPIRKGPLLPGPIEPPLSDKIINGAEYLELASDKLDLVNQGVQLMYDKIAENSGAIEYAKSQAQEALLAINKMKDDLEASTLTKSLAADIKDPIYAALDSLAQPNTGALPSLILVLQDVEHAFDSCKKEKDETIASLNSKVDLAKKSIIHTDVSKRTLPKRLKDLANAIRAFGQ
jgi:hypothetical protein